MLTDRIQSYIAHCWVNSRRRWNATADVINVKEIFLVGLKFGIKKYQDRVQSQKYYGLQATARTKLEDVR